MKHSAIEGVNPAVNVGTGSLIQQEVLDSCLEQEAKLVTGSLNQKGVMQLYNEWGSTFQITNKGVEKYGGEGGRGCRTSG